jgi:hypothetical protein
MESIEYDDDDNKNIITEKNKVLTFFKNEIQDKNKEKILKILHQMVSDVNNFNELGVLVSLLYTKYNNIDKHTFSEYERCNIFCLGQESVFLLSIFKVPLSTDHFLWYISGGLGIFKLDHRFEKLPNDYINFYPLSFQFYNHKEKYKNTNEIQEENKKGNKKGNGNGNGKRKEYELKIHSKSNEFILIMNKLDEQSIHINLKYRSIEERKNIEIDSTIEWRGSILKEMNDCDEKDDDIQFHPQTKFRHSFKIKHMFKKKCKDFGFGWIDRTTFNNSIKLNNIVSSFSFKKFITVRLTLHTILNEESIEKSIFFYFPIRKSVEIKNGVKLESEFKIEFSNKSSIISCNKYTSSRLTIHECEVVVSNITGLTSLSPLRLSLHFNKSHYELKNVNHETKMFLPNSSMNLLLPCFVYKNDLKIGYAFCEFHQVHCEENMFRTVLFSLGYTDIDEGDINDWKIFKKLMNL